MVPGQSFVSQAWPQDHAGKGELRSLVPGLFFLRYETFFLEKKCTFLLSSLGHAFIEYTPEKKNELVNLCIAFSSAGRHVPIPQTKIHEHVAGNNMSYNWQKEMILENVGASGLSRCPFSQTTLAEEGRRKAASWHLLSWGALSTGVKSLSCFCLCESITLVHFTGFPTRTDGKL